MSSRLLTAFSLPLVTLAQLHELRLNTAGDVLRLTPHQLASDMQTTEEQMTALQKQITAEFTISTTEAQQDDSHGGGGAELNARQLNAAIQTVSAATLMRGSAEQRTISAMCPAIDALLDGGVKLGRVTELCGVPGIGKTQLTMQVCVGMQLRTCAGASDTALIIDTEGGFMVSRLQHIATAALGNAEMQCHSSSGSDESPVKRPTMKSMLSNIQIVRVYNHIELLACVHWLRHTYLPTHGGAKLIAIDSIAAPLRAANKLDYNARTVLVGRLAAELQAIAQDFDIAVSRSLSIYLCLRCLTNIHSYVYRCW